MKRFTLFLVFTLLFGIGQAQYKPDILGNGFLQQTLTMPDDYDGKVVTTLVKRAADTLSHKAVLYVHGYNDYFFQREMAEQFNNNEFNFYAVDLRKYGRSILPGQTPFQTHDLEEYFADIDTALYIIKKEANTEIILMGHSTGGLITALYCQKHKERLPVQALILNSPFLDMNQSWFHENIAIPLVSLYGKLRKTDQIEQGASTAYSESLLKSKHGEWEFDTGKKLEQSPPLTTGWMRAIHLGQEKVQEGLNIPCPVLVMFSDKSISESDWSPAHQSADGVLDVKDIAKYGWKLGGQVSEVEIKDGLHDLVLSRKEVRETVYQTIFNWLRINGLNK